MNQIHTPGFENKPVTPHEYAAKTYTTWEQIRFGIKLFAIGGLVFLLFALVEKLHLYY